MLLIIFFAISIIGLIINILRHNCVIRCIYGMDIKWVYVTLITEIRYR